LTHKFQNDRSEKHNALTTNGPSNHKVVPRNEIFGPKKNFSNRLSCVMDYKTTELNGSLRRNKLSGRLGLGVSNTSGQQQKEKKKCFLCDKEGVTQCPWCHSSYYCSDEHQAVHRPGTKCFPLKVGQVEGKGRGLIATRPIRARETILVESSVLSGPAMITSSVCPSCLAPIRTPMFPCTKCSLPVCNPVCQENKAHQQECKLLTDNRVKVNITNCEEVNSIYSFILPYRLLKLREQDKEKWSRVASLPDHIRERAGLGEWDMNQKDVVNFIRRRCFMGKEFSDEDIQRAIGIISVNSISLEPRRLFAGPAKGLSGRGIFPTFALINHSCVGNSRFRVDDKQHIWVEAKEDIKEGEEITVQYYSTLLGTHKRRRRLKAEWYFDCWCARCVEPEECGTMVSAVTCEACEEGFLLPRNPLDCYSDWPCNSCDFYLEVTTNNKQYSSPGLQVPDLERKVDQLEEELNYLSSKRDLKRLESFIEEISGKVLHPHHYLMLIARRNYKYISHKMLISELARCSNNNKNKIKEKFRVKVEEMDTLGWISKLLLGDE